MSVKQLTTQLSFVALPDCAYVADPNTFACCQCRVVLIKAEGDYSTCYRCDESFCSRCHLCSCDRIAEHATQEVFRKWKVTPAEA